MITMSATIDRICILHVDDDPDFTDLVTTFLEREDDRFDVETTNSASEGLDHLSETEFDCVISDYDMPGRNGIQFLDAVREEHPDLPFILFTGKGSEEVASEAISAGVTDYLQKGMGTEQYELLANRILNAVDAYRSRQLAAERTRRLETLISNLPGMVYRCRNTPGWPMETVEGEIEDLTGYSADELESNDVVWGEEVLYPDDRDAICEAVQEGLTDGGSFEITYRITTKDGTTKWIWEQGQGVYTDGDEPNALEGFITDITERKEREAELRKKERRYQAMFNDPNILVGLIDTDGTVLDINETAMDYVDATLDDVTGEPFWETPWFDHSEPERQEVREWTEQAASGEYVEFEADRVCPDGEPYTVEGVFRPVTNDDGEVVSLLVTSRDITERKRREQELKVQTEELKEQYRDLFEEAPVMAVMTRNKGGKPIIKECNQLFLDTLGYDRSDVIGHELATFYTLKSMEVLLEQGGYERALTGEFVREDRELVTAEGDVVETLLRAVPRRDADDSSGTLAMYIDTTERKQLKREIERLKEFTSIVAHDLRNPLNVAEGSLELAREECNSPYLDDIARAHERMNTLIDNLLTLARKGEHVGETKPVELADLIEIYRQNVEMSDATIQTNLVRTIQADRSRLAQLLENLMRNAVEHGGEDVTITVGEIDDGFYVEDNGVGIPEDERDDVFGAGYSTTDDDTGFGLSIVRQIAKAHGWDIRVTDGTDGGARFEITGVEFTDE